MEVVAMLRTLLPLLAAAVVAVAVPAAANEGIEADISTKNSICACVVCDTVGVGHSNIGPGGAFLSSGARAAAGVYFHRLDGVVFGPGPAPNKMILLGR